MPCPLLPCAPCLFWDKRGREDNLCTCMAHGAKPIRPLITSHSHAHGVFCVRKRMMVSICTCDACARAKAELPTWGLLTWGHTQPSREDGMNLFMNETQTAAVEGSSRWAQTHRSGNRGGEKSTPPFSFFPTVTESTRRVHVMRTPSSAPQRMHQRLPEAFRVLTTRTRRSHHLCWKSWLAPRLSHVRFLFLVGPNQR